MPSSTPPTASHKPYPWTPAGTRTFNDTGSTLRLGLYALTGRLLSSRSLEWLMSYGRRARAPRDITQCGHVFMVIDGLRYDTSRLYDRSR